MPFLAQKPKALPNPRPRWFHHPVLWILAFPHPPGLHTSLLQAPNMVRKQDSFHPRLPGEGCVYPAYTTAPPLPSLGLPWVFPGMQPGQIDK